MEKAYEAYGLKVTVGSTSMTFKPGETRHIYVKAGSAVKYAFAYTRLSGEEGEAPLTSDQLPKAPEAGTHYTINLTMDDKLGLDISKVEAEEICESLKGADMEVEIFTDTVGTEASFKNLQGEDLPPWPAPPIS